MLKFVDLGNTEHLDTASERVLSEAKGRDFLDISIDISLRHKENSSWYSDIAFGDLEVSYVLERLAEASQTLAMTTVQTGYFRSIRARANRIATAAVVSLLDDTSEDAHDAGRWHELLAAHEDRVWRRPESLRVPEFGDAYMANHVHAWDDSSTDPDSRLVPRPEWTHRAWRCCTSSRIGNLFFQTSYGHIIPPGANPHSVISAHGHSGLFAPAALLLDPLAGSRAAPPNTSNIVYISCPSRPLRLRGSKIVQLHAVSNKLFPDSATNDPFCSLLEVNACPQSGAVAIEFSNATIIAWADDIPHDGYKGAVKLLDLAAPSISFDWKRLSPARFEELCHDFLEYQGFVNIRQIGLTNSRDGGKDFLAQKRSSEPYGAKERWVVQCKRLTSRKSVTATLVPSISDICIEEGAVGFALITTAVGDATLHNRLSRLIGRGVLTESRVYTGADLERFLRRMSNVRQRYFPVSEASSP